MTRNSWRRWPRPDQAPAVTRVLGIDCGAEQTGYGVIESDGRRHRMIAAGVIRARAGEPLADRLRAIAAALRDIIAQYAPAAVAIEDVFCASNARTALRLAHVRGVALLSAAEAGLPVGEYSPLQVKMSVVGYGRARKEQVKMMVRSLLALEETLASEDAADALAVAICHATRQLGGSPVEPRA
ncbi:MAG: crossover junction endodeoxyribonuclease RuvC [Bryobacteraceae bacterium]